MLIVWQFQEHEERSLEIVTPKAGDYLWYKEEYC